MDGSSHTRRTTRRAGGARDGHGERQVAAVSDEGVADVDLGLPVPPGARHRLARRLVAKLAWPMLRHQVALNRRSAAALDDLASRVARLEGLVERLAEYEARLGQLEGSLAHHSEVLTRQDVALERHEQIVARQDVGLDDLRERIERVADEIDLVHRQVFARYHEGIADVRSELGELGSELGELARGVDDGRRLLEEHARRLDRAVADFWPRLAQVDLVLADLRRALPSPPPREVVEAAPSAFEQLYDSFEYAFRGPPHLIEERVRPYLADVAQLPDLGPVLDVGCGRGDWLRVLREAGIDAYGVDTNRAAVEKARQAGLRVELEDAIAHLARLEAGSLRAVSAIHLVEHLETGALIELLDRAFVALGAGASCSSRPRTRRTWLLVPRRSTSTRRTGRRCRPVCSPTSSGRGGSPRWRCARSPVPRGRRCCASTTRSPPGRGTSRRCSSS